MKTPESPRAYPPTVADALSNESRPEIRVPRYVQAPALRDHGLGPRNLFWGVALLFLAFLLLIVAIFMVGAMAMTYVAACLLTFTALFVLTRLHVFRQRNGGFLALGLVCLIGTAFPLVEKAYSSAKNFVSSRSASGAPTVTFHSDDQGPPLLTQSFALSEPPADGKQIKVVRDTQVVISDKPFLIKAGDRFPLIATKGDQTTFAVRDLLLSLPTAEVEVVDPNALAKGVGINTAPAAAQANHPAGPKADAKANARSDAELAEVTRNSQREAMRRYPALALPDSLENAVFISTYKELRAAGSDEFFADPKWPMVLADMLAKKEGWIVGGAPITTGPPPVLDPPPDNAPADTAPADNSPAADNAPLDAPLTPPSHAAAPGGLAPPSVPRAQPVRRAPVALPSVDALDAGGGLPRASGPGR